MNGISWSHSAGLRTHILVGVGRPRHDHFIYGFGAGYPNRDPARLAAQVVSGIGFIGAGTIIQTGTDIKGLDDGTTLWLTMAIGLASGSGRFVIAIVTTVIALITLIILRKVEHYASRKSPENPLSGPDRNPVLKQIHFVASRLGVSVKDFQSQIVNVGGQVFLRVSLRIAYMSTATSAALVEELKKAINSDRNRISDRILEVLLGLIGSIFEIRPMGNLTHNTYTVVTPFLESLETGRVSRFFWAIFLDTELRRPLDETKRYHRTEGKRLDHRLGWPAHPGIAALIKAYDFMPIGDALKGSRPAVYPLLVILDSIQDLTILVPSFATPTPSEPRASSSEKTDKSPNQRRCQSFRPGRLNMFPVSK
jgi:putative Mg2+ transporter-C (MgtC) family protein